MRQLKIMYKRLVEKGETTKQLVHSCFLLHVIRFTWPHSWWSIALYIRSVESAITLNQFTIWYQNVHVYTCFICVKACTCRCGRCDMFVSQFVYYEVYMSA